MFHSDEELESAKDEEIDYQGSLRQLTSKLDDMNTCNDLIEKHFANLQRALSDLEKNPEQDTAARSKIISERATLFKITSNAMINVGGTVYIICFSSNLHVFTLLPELYLPNDNLP